MTKQFEKKHLKQFKNQSQNGRSMVEMLGVLAIIGVLSIGGIAGYRMTMNRYQANQIANEINLMRTDAKMKVVQGAEKLMLGEPYDSGHLNFGTNYGVDFDFIDIKSEDESVTEAGYYIKISGISAGVCKPLVTLLNGMNETVALKVNDGEYSADSNVDLCTEESNNALEVDFSTEKIISGSGNPEVTDPADEPQECNPETCPGTCNAEGVCECPEGSHLKGDECVTCSGGKVWDGNDCSCPAGAEKSGEDGEECVCSTEKPHWNGTECTACPEGSNWNSETGECECEDGKVWKESRKACITVVGECESNADCGPGEYCYMMSGYDCGDGKEFDSSKFGGYSNYVSECRNARKDAVMGEKTDFALGWPEGTKKGFKYMNWWSAERFCEALGMSRPTRASIGCGSVSHGMCTSEIRQNLYEDFNKNKASNKFWLEDYGNSCFAYGIALDDGNVGDYRRPNALYALCE